MYPNCIEEHNSTNVSLSHIVQTSELLFIHQLPALNYTAGHPQNLRANRLTSIFMFTLDIYIYPEFSREASFST